jgi:hypothetical protein
MLYFYIPKLKHFHYWPTARWRIAAFLKDTHMLRKFSLKNLLEDRLAGVSQVCGHLGALI